MGSWQSSEADTDSDESKRATAGERLRTMTFFSALPELRARFRGEVVSPEDREAYTTARRRPYNHDSRGFPLLILRPLDTEDVAVGVDFVRTRCEGVVFCVMGGGSEEYHYDFGDDDG